jgi:hypothetical protein
MIEFTFILYQAAVPGPEVNNSSFKMSGAAKSISSKYLHES